MSEEAKKLFGTNGFRGVVGRELTPEIAIKFGMAVGTYFKEGRIAVGMDGRTSSDMLRSCLLYTSPSPRDLSTSRMPSSA